MTHEPQTNHPDTQPVSFSNHLLATREARNLTRADVAAQLRLNEKYIAMMEKDRYPADLPTAFVRGYLRAYAKLLQIPELEVKKALESIKPKPTAYEVKAKQAIPAINNHSFTLLFSYLFTFLTFSLIGIWCYKHHITLASFMSKTNQHNPITEALSASDRTVAVSPSKQLEQTPLSVERAATEPHQPIPTPTSPPSEPTHDTLSANEVENTDNVP